MEEGLEAKVPGGAPSVDEEVRREYRAELPGVEVTLRFLGSCLLEEPSEGYVRAVLEPGVWAGIPFGRKDADVLRGLSLVREWREGHVGDEAACAGLSELRGAWFRIFVGAGRPVAAPWQSVYTDDEAQLFTEQTRDVRAWYRRFGLEPARLNREPDDHIGLMLEFLASLCAFEQRCACDTEMAGLQRDQLDFVARHVMVFLDDWVRDVVEKGGNTFYAVVALMVRGAVRARVAQLEASPWAGVASE